MRNIIKRIINTCLVIFSATLLTGCFELDFETLEDYYLTINNDVGVYTADPTGVFSDYDTVEYSTYLFNDSTVNDIDDILTPKLLPQYFEYMIIYPNLPMKLNEFSIFFKTFEDTSFKIRAFVENSLAIEGKLAIIRSFKLPKEGAYTDKFEKPIYEGNVITKNDQWESLYADSWTVDGNSTNLVDIKFGECLVIQFLNNTGYGADEGLKPATFIPTNVILAPFNPKD